MPYIRETVQQWFFETDIARGSFISEDYALLEKWKKMVIKSHGKDVRIQTHELDMYLWEEPAKIEKAKKEDES